MCEDLLGSCTDNHSVCQQWDLEQAVFDIALPRGESLFVFLGDSLFADKFKRVGAPAPDVSPFSPTQEVICPQELLEPMLRERAEALGADVRFSTRLANFCHDADGVTAQVLNTHTGETREVRAQWMVAADGVRGEVRSMLGIGRSGTGAIGNTVSVLVDADLTDRTAGLYRLNRPRPGAALAAVDNRRRRLLIVPHDPEIEPPDTFTDDRCAALARAAFGDESLDLAILATRFWQPTSLVADRFGSGPVFLAGDAAHATTPVGGLGMNCGLADAHNLAWKLAGVLAGWADPLVLDSYEPERQPIARACAEASLGPARPPARVDGLVLGYCYESPIIVDDGTPAPSVDNPIGDYTPTGRPGARAPHLWLTVNGNASSILDLFGEAFVVLSGPRPRPDPLEVTAELGVPLRVESVVDARWHELYGIRPDGAVLVRPDGHVAWRSIEAPANPDKELHAALLHATGRARAQIDGYSLVARSSKRNQMLGQSGWARCASRP
jgi:2-polyprenyl-6-methoxyphenol hydroxylase-like FAD-dependent oxidoreductase